MDNDTTRRATTHADTSTTSLMLGRGPGGSSSKLRRIRAAIFSLAALSFLAGGLVSYIAFRGFNPAVALSSTASVADEDLARMLRLDDAQRHELEAVLQESDRKMNRLREEIQDAYRQRLDAVIDETERAILERVIGDSDDQRARFEEWQSSRQAR